MSRACLRWQPEQLPLLSRLRQEAAQIRARQARLSTAHTDVIELRTHLHRMKRLLALVKRRERLKAQICALHQAHFETCVKQRRQLLNGHGLSANTPHMVGGGGGGPSRGMPSVLMPPAMMPPPERDGSPPGKRVAKMETAPLEFEDLLGLPADGSGDLSLLAADGMLLGNGVGGSGHRRSGRQPKDKERFADLL